MWTEQVAFLRQRIADARNSAVKQKALHRCARNGHVAALQAIIGDRPSLLGERETIEAYGQQINFQLRVVYPAALLRFEEIARN